MHFLPTTIHEAQRRGWDTLDVIFVSGDAYIDHPAFGVPLLARWLEAYGFKVGIIAQPDWRSKEAFMVLGRPKLFFAVSAGAMDSMVAHYTPARKLRHDDAYTPGNVHGKRPNRATIIYTSRIKEAFKDVPVIIGGIEASLRRFAHYDFWQDAVRRSILLDSKADLLIYGMAEQPLLTVAQRMKAAESLADIYDVRGTAYVSKINPPSDQLVQEIPSFEAVVSDKKKFIEAFVTASREQNPYCGKTLLQRHGDRFLICNPPILPLSEQVMDSIYALPFQKAPHPSYQQPIPAWEQIKCSITSHRGCFGGCAFCAIVMHQGKIIQSRSEASVLKEVGVLSQKTWFRGSISDIGGPTANMYGLSCGKSEAMHICRKPSCLYPQICKHLNTDDLRAVNLLKAVRNKPGIKHVAVSSGIRYDLLEKQPAYFDELIRHHISGLLKVAPEHLVDRVTDLMQKPGKQSFISFLSRFQKTNAQLGKKQQIVPYFISGHPGCTLQDMLELALTLKKLGLRVEQVQDFTPTPGTLSTCMFYTGIHPLTGKPIYVAKTDREKALQKALLLWHLPGQRKKVFEALQELGRQDLVSVLCKKEQQRDGMYHNHSVGARCKKRRQSAGC
jgi:uncharacterized radical SAM protein YgiQ